MKITEKYIKSFKGDNEAYEVFENPEMDEIREILADADDTEISLSRSGPKSLRGFVLNDGRVLAWHEDKRNHLMAVKDLKLTDQKPIPIYMHVSNDLKRLKDFTTSLWTMQMMGYGEQEIAEMVRKVENNSYLISLFKEHREANENSINELFSINKRNTRNNMAILEELGKLIEKDIEGDEEDNPVEKDTEEEMDDEVDEEPSSGDEGIAGMTKHIEAVRAAAEFVDKLTTDEGNTTAFEAEVALRRAIDRMQNLADESKSSKPKE